MKVTDVRTFLVDPGTSQNWLFVKVETDEGIVGWGECYTQADRDLAIQLHVQAMRRYLIGRDPFNIKHFTDVMYRDFASKRGSMDLFSAISGIEQALWDVVGKFLMTPVYNLLGGACRDQVRVYANGWARGKGPSEVAERAVEVVERGFSALKFDPFPGPWQPFISRQDELAAVANVRAVRDAVGPDVEILVEVHRRLAPMHAIRVARMIEEYRPFWYEEPCAPENLEALAEVRRGINIPVVTGEALYAKAGFREVFERRAADILNPDICNCGGILELKEIAAMAEPYLVAMSPHNYNSMSMGLAASVQLCAAIPNFLILEYFVNFEKPSAEIAPNALKPVNGYIPIPTGPGLGVELDEEALSRKSYREYPIRAIRQFSNEGP
jgi:galactonate dehydratase